MLCGELLPDSLYHKPVQLDNVWISGVTVSVTCPSSVWTINAKSRPAASPCSRGFLMRRSLVGSAGKGSGRGLPPPGSGGPGGITPGKLFGTEMSVGAFLGNRTTRRQTNSRSVKSRTG